MPTAIEVRSRSRGGRLVEGVAGLGAVGVAAFAVTIWALPQVLVPALEPLRVGVVVAAIMAAGLTGRALLGGALPTAGGHRGAALAVLLAIALASPAWSVDPATSRWASLELCKLALVYLAAASLLDTPPRLRRALWAAALAGTVPAYHAVRAYLLGENLLEGYRARWAGTFLDPNRLAMSVTASALLLLALRSRLRSHAGRVVVLVALGLQVAAVIVTYSRGATLGLAAGVLAWILLGRTARTRSIAVVGALGLALLLFAPERFWNRTGSIAAYEEDASALGRIDAWRTAGRVLERRPLGGVGASAFLAAWPSYAPGDAGPRAYVAHNLLLEIAAELGIPALLAFLLLAGGCLRGGLRAARAASPVREEARGVLAAAAGYLVCQLFAGYTLSFFTFWLLGLAAAAERVAARASPDLVRRTVRAAPAPGDP